MGVELHNRVPQLASVNPYQTDDLDAARHYIGSLFAPHRLDIVGPNQILDVCISCAQLERGSSFVYHRHGASVRVQPELFLDFYLLQIPIRGVAIVKIDRQEIYCSPKQAVIISPTSGVDMYFEKGCEQLIVRVEKQDIERHLEQMMGRPLDSPLKFAPVVPLTTVNSKEITDLLSLITMSLTNATGLSSSAVARRQMGSLLFSGLLSCLEHNYSNRLGNEIDKNKPTYLIRAQNYIQNHFSEPITPDDIASAAYISTRALFASFRDYLNTTPMRHLKDLRLEQVRQALINAEQHRTSVTTIAMEHGFHHLGHFCAAYKDKFGELPHETLNPSSDH